MKRPLTALLAVLCLSGCMTIDWKPVTFRIIVQDEQGTDLLDPINDNRWLLGTTIHYRGITVELEEASISGPVTKALPAMYQGFRLEKGPDRYYLAFGEFDGGSNYDDEDIMIRWSDGSVNVITYTRKINSITVSAREVFKLDGVKCSDPIVIVK